MSLPVLIVACGGTKLSGKHRADQIYTGPLWKTYRKNAPLDDQGNPIGFRLYVISAKYGLVRGDDVLPSYDRVLVRDNYKGCTKDGTYVRRVSDLLPLVRSQARDEGLYGLPADEVFYAGAVGSREKPGPYLQVLRGAGLRFTPLSRTLPGRGGSGRNNEALKAWLDALKKGRSLPRAQGAQRMRSARQRAQAQRLGGGDVTGITPGVGLHFASGSNTETEIRALVDANRAFGISLAEVGGPRRPPKLQERVLALQQAGASRQQAIRQAVSQAKERQAPGMVVLTSLYSRPGNKPPLFIDSGAFSEIKKGDDLTDEQWRERLGLVIKFLETIGPAAAALVTVVAPDKVGDQAETLARLRRYRELVRQIHRLGARVVVPLQAGRLSLQQMDAEVQRILAPRSTYRWWVPGLPLTRQSPLKNRKASDYLKQVRPARVHLLGVGGGNQERLPAIREAIRQHAPDTLVQMDSMLWRRTTTDKARAKLKEASAGWEVDLSRDELGDFTEDVAEPSVWTSPLERYEVGKRALLGPDDLLSWVVDPDHYIHDGSREHAYLYQTLESLWVEKERARRGAIRELEPVEILQDPDFTGPQWVEIY